MVATMTGIEAAGNILGGIALVALFSPFVIAALGASGWLLVQMIKALPKFLESLDDAKSMVKAYRERNR